MMFRDYDVQSLVARRSIVDKFSQARAPVCVTSMPPHTQAHDLRLASLVAHRQKIRRPRVGSGVALMQGSGSGPGSSCGFGLGQGLGFGQVFG